MLASAPYDGNPMIIESRSSGRRRISGVQYRWRCSSVFVAGWIRGCRGPAADSRTTVITGHFGLAAGSKL